MPNEMKRIPFAEKVPEANKDSETVSYYRTEYDSNHSVEFGQYNREHNIAANLEHIADVIA